MFNTTEEVGKYFGYPICCISSYEKILINGGKKTAEQAYLTITDSSGFIPCPEHSKQILEGKITINSLINNRICPFPFPEEPDIEVLDEYLTSLTI